MEKDSMNSLPEIIQQIKARRKALRLSQEELAKAAGLCRGYVSMLERGAASNPSYQIVRQLCQALTLENTPPHDYRELVRPETLKTIYRDVTELGCPGAGEEILSYVMHSYTEEERRLFLMYAPPEEQAPQGATCGQRCDTCGKWVPVADDWSGAPVWCMECYTDQLAAWGP